MSFDVVIIGGGLYGTVNAYLLAQKKLKVLLLEKHKIGTSGATSYSQGIVRVYDPDPDLREISFLGANKFINWEKNNYPGKTPYTKVGFLYLLNKSKSRLALDFIDKYNCKEYPIGLLKSLQIKKKFPFIKETDSKIGIYEKYGGFGNPTDTALKFSMGFKELGGTIYENCEINNDMISQTQKGWNIKLLDTLIQSKAILFTVGAFIKDFFADLSSFTRTITLAQYNNLNYSKYPINISVVDEEIETYIRPLNHKSFYSGSQVFEEISTPRFIQNKQSSEYKDANARLFNLLNNKLKIYNYFKGYDSYTKEKRPIIGFLKNGLYVATGFSGRGYKYSISLSEKITTEIVEYLKTGYQKSIIK